MPLLFINVKHADYNLSRTQPNRSEADKRSSQYILLMTSVYLWPSGRSTPEDQAVTDSWKNAVLRELYEVAILAETDINTQTFRGKTPADYQLEAVYFPTQRRN